MEGAHRGVPHDHGIPKDATSFEADVRGNPAIRAAGLRLVDLGVSTATAELFRGSVLGLENYIEF